MKIVLCLITLLILSDCYSQSASLSNGYALYADTIAPKNFFIVNPLSGSTPVKAIPRPFSPRPLIIPAGLITYSIWALNNHGLRQMDWSAKKMIERNTKNFKSGIDNYLQYAPALAVYGLNATGIKGKNSFTNRSVMYGLTTILTGITVCSAKHFAGITRPDGSADNSFPSGHTTTAFAAAEFLHQEYKDKSIWYSIGGYAAATATGILRMYNNRHFLSDVVAGAGIGMLSTKLVYMVYPALKKKLSRRHASLQSI